MTQLRFRIYYGGGQTYNGDPYFAPPSNVQAVVQESTIAGAKPAIMHSKDMYYYRPDIGWNGCDTPGLWDYLLNYAGPKSVIFGRSIRDEEYWKAVQQAIEEGLG